MAIADQQAAKAARLHPYVPSAAERFVENMQERMLATPNGFYPWLDSVYGGGGFTLGAGYRRFYGDRTYWDGRGLVSTKAYKRFELSTDSVGLEHGHVDTHLLVGWRDATEVAFYGIGGNTAPDARSNFRMKEAYVGGALTRRGPGPLLVDLGLAYEDYSLESGRGDTPSIEEAFPATAVPGLGDSPSFAHVTWSGGVDSRPSPGYARRGGLYALTYETYLDPNHTYSFDRAQLELLQHIPILRENWVLSLHGVAQTTVDDQDTVPYFLLPSLGSGSTLRGYPSWRFRDRHSLLMSGEWRWFPSRMFMDMAIFYDTGKVASRREDLNFNGLKSDVGVGVRFHSPLATPLRIDIAHGSEGFNIVFSGSAAF